MNDVSFLPSVSIRVLDLAYIKQSDVFEKEQISTDTLRVNYEKFNQYAQLILNIRHRHFESDKHFKHKFRLCTDKDFEKNGYDISKSFSHIVKGRLCPDVPEEAPWYMIKNVYANETERVSISLQIVKCNKNLNKNQICKSDREIEAFLDNVYFTMFSTSN